MICNEPKIFYKIDGVLYRNSNFKEDNLIRISEEFRENTVLESREKAFNYFQSLLDVLLEGIGLKYQNQKQAERELSCFYKSNLILKHPKLPNVFFDNDTDKLITISFCSTNAEPYITKTGLTIYDEEKIIYAFGYQAELLKDKIQRNLLIEELVKV